MTGTAWNWEQVLTRPAFWASYLELYLDDEEVDDLDAEPEPEEEDDLDAEPETEKGPALTAHRVFGDDPDPRDFDAALHNHAATTQRFYRQLLDEAGGDLDAVLERLIADTPFATSHPGERDRIRALLQQAHGPAPCNKEIVIPLDGGFAFVIELEPGATLFHLDDAGTRLRFGDISGHHALPALSWDEVFAIEHLAEHTLGGSFLARHVGLLLYPTTWTAIGDDLAAVRSRVRAGILRAGVVRVGEEDALAERLAQPSPGLDIGFEPHAAPGQSEGFSWWRDESHGWVNNSPYSPRNPSLLHGYKLDADGFARVARWDATLGLRRG